MQAADTFESSAEGEEAVPFLHDRCHRATLCMGLWTHTSNNATEGSKCAAASQSEPQHDCITLCAEQSVENMTSIAVKGVRTACEKVDARTYPAVAAWPRQAQQWQ